MDSWIDITEFSIKYGVSASTLRRRIRTNTIPFKMERGKYIIKDTPEALSAAPLFSRRMPNPELAAQGALARQQVRPSNGYPLNHSNSPSGQRGTSPARTFSDRSSVPELQNAYQNTYQSSYQLAEQSLSGYRLHDPVEDLLNSDAVLPLRMKSEFESLTEENRRLKSQISELETLVKVLESELSMLPYQK